MSVKHVLSLGAGVQSSTIALMAAAGEITPMPDAAIFADTSAEAGTVGTVWLHRSCKPLAEIDFDDLPSQTNQFGNECEGVCGV